ncbi:MAG: hypothetical protein IIB71_16475 [Proteobacteria bacterium]|nr:hypothetical protein [Pseudomonadota bacterium]
MIYKKIYFVLFALTVFFSSTVSAEEIQLVFEGVINNDPNEPFRVTIEYSSDAVDLNSGQECCGKYVPMAITFTHNGEIVTNPNAGLNVDNIPSELFEGIQWVDDGEPWTGTLLGQTVKTLGINFGNQINNPGGSKYSGERSKELPLTVVLDEWDFHNGGFTLEDDTQHGFEILVQLFDNDKDGIFGNDDQCQDTDADTVVDETGCSIAQICADTGVNRGGLVACTARASEEFVQSGLITAREMAQIIRTVARSN